MWYDRNCLNADSHVRTYACSSAPDSPPSAPPPEPSLPPHTPPPPASPPPPSAPPASPPIPWDLRVFTETATWYEAKARCMDLGLALVSVHTWEQFFALKPYITQMWLGVGPFGVNGTLAWHSNGEAPTTFLRYDFNTQYARYNQRELPWPVSFTDPAHCVYYQHNSKHGDQWITIYSTADCERKHRYACSSRQPWTVSPSPPPSPPPFSP
eukprot:4610601-Pleurochrysis_carterae.AAC.1